MRRTAAAVIGAALALVLSVVGWPPATAKATAVVPSSIDSTCATDVTADLTAFIAAQPDGHMTLGGARPTVIQFQPGGCYRVEGTLELVNRNLLTLDGNSSTFRATISAPYGDFHKDRARAMWRTRNGSKITFTSMTVVGANPYAGTGDLAYNAAYEAQHGFDLLGTKGADVGSVTVSDVWGDFVYVGLYGRTPDGLTVRSEDVTIHDSTFTRNGRQGVAVAAGRNVLIERVSISQTRRATFDVEPTLADWLIDDVVIRDNQIGPGRLLTLAMGGAAAPIHNVTFERNVLVGKPLNGTIKNPTCVAGITACDSVRTRGLRQGITIRDNVSDRADGNPQGYLLGFFGADDITVTGNVAPVQPGRSMYLAAFYDVCGGVVSGNTVPGGLGELIVKAPCSQTTT